MYYQKMTREEKQRQFDAFVRMRNQLEKDQIVISWKAWSKKADDEQIKDINKWNDYFAKVKDSVIYAMYREQRDCAFKGDFAGVKDISSQIKEMVRNNQHITTEEPSFIDPWEFRHNPNIQAYLKAKEGIKEMSDYGEADEIFS